MVGIEEHRAIFLTAVVEEEEKEKRIERSQS